MALQIVRWAADPWSANSQFPLSEGGDGDDGDQQGGSGDGDGDAELEWALVAGAN